MGTRNTNLSPFPFPWVSIVIWHTPPISPSIVYHKGRDTVRNGWSEKEMNDQEWDMNRCITRNQKWTLHLWPKISTLISWTTALQPCLLKKKFKNPLHSTYKKSRLASFEFQFQNICIGKNLLQDADCSDRLESDRLKQSFSKLAISKIMYIFQDIFTQALSVCLLSSTKCKEMKPPLLIPHSSLWTSTSLEVGILFEGLTRDRGTAATCKGKPGVIKKYRLSFGQCKHQQQTWTALVENETDLEIYFLKWCKMKRISWLFEWMILFEHCSTAKSVSTVFHHEASLHMQFCIYNRHSLSL